MTFQDFAKEIESRDRILAPGAETNIYGSFVEDMDRLCNDPEWGWRESETEVPGPETAWWRMAYDIYEADRVKPEEDRAHDVSDIFDAVTV